MIKINYLVINKKQKKDSIKDKKAAFDTTNNYRAKIQKHDY